MAKKTTWKVVKEKAPKPSYKPLKGGTFGAASRVKVFSKDERDAWLAENANWIDNLKKIKKDN